MSSQVLTIARPAAAPPDGAARQTKGRLRSDKARLTRARSLDSRTTAAPDGVRSAMAGSLPP